jgi:tagatose 6-phosphate kinase
MLEQCKKRGIKCYGPFLEGWNRFCFTFSSNNNFNETELLGRGPEIGKKDLEEFISEFERQLIHSSAVVMSGSLPMGCPAGFYKELISITHSHNIPTVLDTSGVALSEAICEKPTILHLNEHEGRMLTGKNDINEIIEELRVSAEISALTLGARGLYLSANNETWIGNVKVDKVLGTVGSGDCLVAGITMAYTKGCPLEEVAKYGTAFGAANCMTKELGIINKEDVDYLLPKVELLTVDKNGKEV